MIPLIDVMLVLLVVFIITAPLLTQSIKIDLPQVTAQTHIEIPETVVIAINAQGTLHWNDLAISDAELPAKLLEAALKKTQPELHLRADRETRYQKVAEVMGLAQKAGIKKMGFMTHGGCGP
ncbi:MAG: biopolymer transporter ExbD, partial [Candidatus Nitrotoga sp.]